MAKSRVLFIAPLPPPVHGSAMVSQYIKDSKLVNELHDCDFVNLSTSRRMDEIGKGGMKKLLRFVGAYFAVSFKLLTHRYDLCYLAITCHGMGFLKDAPFVLLCKLFRRKVLIHQHNKGMSHCVHRWPYRWLMPLVYRNTTVMLLSWHLYDDIAAVVKREQVVICANGIPQITINEDERLKAAEQRLIATESQVKSCGAAVKPESSLLTAHGSSLTNSKQEYSHTDFTDYTDSRTRCACAGHPDGNSKHYTLHTTQDNLTQNTQTSQNGTRCASAGHPDGDSTHYTLHTKQVGSHTDYTESTDSLSCQRDLDEITQNGKSLRPCGLPDGNTKHYTLNTIQTKSLPNGVSAMSESPLFGRGRGEAPHLLFLSNLIPSKGVYVLLDACRMLHEQGLTFVCDFVGGETKEIDRATFEEAVKERGLQGIARYQGPKYGEEKERYFAEADIFVFPTFYYNECFPLVLLEAMQHRLPVVSSDEGGIPDIIQHGVNGYTVARKEAAPLAEALALLITNPAQRREMGEAGYARYQELYTLEAFEHRFVERLFNG